jgi:uncharacterized protein YegP (UPF0339 family)
VAAKFEIRAANGGWTWMATSQGRTLAIGESYTTKAAAANAIASLRKGAPTAPIVDLTSRPAKTPARAPKTTTRAAKKTIAEAKAPVPKAGTKKTATPRKRSSRSG